MISLETFRLFSGVCGSRLVYTAPRVVGDRIAATDGRILVEAPVTEVETTGLEVIDGEFPNYRPLIDSAFSAPFVAIEMPVVPPRVEKLVKCPECAGTGEYEEFGVEFDCEACDGLGEWMDDSEWTIVLPNPSGFSWPRVVAARFVERANLLPGIRWYWAASDHAVDPIRFTFGECGRGLLMCLRRAAAETDKETSAT